MACNHRILGRGDIRGHPIYSANDGSGSEIKRGMVHFRTIPLYYRETQP